jgi:hypothetical protein
MDELLNQMKWAAEHWKEFLTSLFFICFTAVIGIMLIRWAVEHLLDELKETWEQIKGFRNRKKE